MTQQVAAIRSMSGRRSVPAAHAPWFQRRRHQRWRERPRCRDPRVALALSESGSFTPSLVLSNVATTERCLSGRRAPPARLKRCRDRPEKRDQKLARVSVNYRDNFARRKRSSSVSVSRRSGIAPVSLVPCSPSSMLFAALRPGHGPGLRALTTAARGTVWLLRDAGGSWTCKTTGLDGVYTRLTRLAPRRNLRSIVGVSRHHPPIASSATERVASRRSRSTTPPTQPAARSWRSHVTVPCEPDAHHKRASTRAL